jgi:hypothetical protein
MLEPNAYNYGEERIFLEEIYKKRDPLHPNLTVCSREQVYFLSKASFVCRILEHLKFMQATHAWSVEFVTIINQFDGWVIRVRLDASWPPTSRLYLQDFIREMGELYNPTPAIQAVFDALEGGESILEVMNRYHITVVDHGLPKTDEIEVFREYLIDGLGYCPETLA